MLQNWEKNIYKYFNNKKTSKIQIQHSEGEALKFNVNNLVGAMKEFMMGLHELRDSSEQEVGASSESKFLFFNDVNFFMEEK